MKTQINISINVNNQPNYSLYLNLITSDTCWVACACAVLPCTPYVQYTAQHPTHITAAIEAMSDQLVDCTECERLTKNRHPFEVI